MRRAARWDGAFPISLGSNAQDFVETTADDLREIDAYRERMRVRSFGRFEQNRYY